MSEWITFEHIKLKGRSFINACYTRNGVETIKKLEKSRPVKIHHISHLAVQLFLNASLNDHEVYCVQIRSLLFCDKLPDLRVWWFLNKALVMTYSYN